MSGKKGMPWNHGLSVEERLWSRVEIGDGCWRWAGCVDQSGSGYPLIQVAGKPMRATRLVYSLSTGQPIPRGMLVCHRCDNKRCVRPSHLFLGTPADNMLDKVWKGRHARGEAHSRAIKKAIGTL